MFLLMTCYCIDDGNDVVVIVSSDDGGVFVV